jgi:hypothetical protein
MKSPQNLTKKFESADPDALFMPFMTAARRFV